MRGTELWRGEHRIVNKEKLEMIETVRSTAREMRFDARTLRGRAAKAADDIRESFERWQLWWLLGLNDIRQRFVFSAVWDLNYARGVSNAAAKAILSGWNLSTISQLQTGRAISVIEDSNLVHSVSIFDVYTGQPIPKRKKSLAFSISFQSGDRTLTDEDVAEERKRIVARLGRELGATLRA